MRQEPRSRTEREEEQQEAVKQVWLTRMQKRADYQAAFGSAAGRRVLQDLMLRYRVFNDARNAFAEGKRMFVFEIGEIIPQIFGEVALGVCKDKEAELVAFEKGHADG